MKLQHLIILTSIFIGLSACGGESPTEQSGEEVAQDEGNTASDAPEDANASKSKATLELSINGKDYTTNCGEHYLVMAKEPGGKISYSIRINPKGEEAPLKAFQLTFWVEEKIKLPYEVELDFKKSATTNKLKTSLRVHYVGENNEVVQAVNEIGKIIITKMDEEEMVLNVDTKLFLLKTMNMKGEGETVELKGTVRSSNPALSLMGGATKEEVL